MRGLNILRLVIVFLTFLDIFSFNIRVTFFNITFLRIIIFTALTVLLFESIKNQTIKIPRTKFALYPLLFFFLWFLYGCLQLNYVNNLKDAMTEMYYFFLFISIILIFSINISYKDWLANIKALFIIGNIIIYFCIIEIITGFHLSSSMFVEENIPGDNKAAAFFYNENDLGLFLVLFFPILLLWKTDKYRFPFKVLSIILVIIILILDDCKSAMLSIALQILILAYINRLNPKWKLLLSFFIPIIIIVTYTYIKGFLLPIFEDLKHGYGPNYIRLNLYKNGLYAFKESNFLGVGPGNFQSNIYNVFDTFGLVDPHNWWIELLTNYGIFIFILYIIFFIILVKRMYALYKRDGLENKIFLALVLSFLGFILGSIGPSATFHFFFVWLFYALAIGGINSYYLNSGQKVK